MILQQALTCLKLHPEKTQEKEEEPLHHHHHLLLLLSILFTEVYG